MKQYILIIAVIISASAFADIFSVKGQTSYFQWEEGSGVKINTIEQYPEGLLVTTSNSFIASSGFVPPPPGAIRYSNSVAVEAPSISVYDSFSKAWDSVVERTPGVIIYSKDNPEVVEPFDMGLFNDWLDVMGYGWIYIKEYPWIFIHEIGVFYFSDSEVRNGQPGYWLYSEKYGWLWSIRDDFPKVYSFRLNEWLEI